VVSDSLDILLETAVEGARRAGRALADRFLGTRIIEFKGGIDLVTDADRVSESLLLTWIRQRHPEHSLLSEEGGTGSGSSDGASAPASGYRWIVDPLDGTTNYAHRLPHYSVSVAVEGEQGVLAGAVYDPSRDELFSAARGRGATLNGIPLQASAVDTLDRALLCTGFPYNVQEHPEGPMGLLQRFIRKAQGIRRFGSSALDLAYVAAGRYDGYFEFGLKPWDVAAGSLIVTEAGGAVTRIDGAPYDTSVTDILAAGPALAPTLQEECRTFLNELGYRPRPFGRQAT
jgi:myo-inositol-1(or 4)-monophosphatase